MTIAAVLGLKNAFATLGLARLFEITNRVEVSEKIGNLVGADAGQRNLLLAHGLPHDRSVIPHPAGDAGRRIVPVETLAQIRTLAPALAINRVTIDTELGPEEFRSPARVGRRPGQQTHRNADNRRQDNTK